MKNGNAKKTKNCTIKWVKIDEDLIAKFPKFKPLDENFCTFSTIISKKTEKLATNRNYYKRFVRNHFIQNCTPDYQNFAICVFIFSTSNFSFEMPKMS